MGKAERKAELEKQYQEELEKLEAEADDENEDEGDVIILRGKARDRFLEKLEAAGYSEQKAEEILETVEDKVEGEEVESETDPKEPEAEGEKKVVSKKEKKEVVEEKNDDPPPPPRNRYFGGKKG